MVEQHYIAPVKHTAGSALGTTAASAAGGAAKTGFKWWGVTTMIGATVGLIAGLALFQVIPIAAIVGETAFSLAAFGKVLGIAITTLGIGGFTAAFIAPAVGAIGAGVGGVKGASRAHDRIQMETGRAHELQSQIDMVRAQNPVAAPAPVMVYAPTNDNNRLVAPGSAMNPAIGKIQGSSVQYDGLVNGQQLLAQR